MVDDLTTTLLAQEHQVWAALVAGDAAADGALLADDFLGLYPDGYAGRADHAAQLASGPSVAEYRLSEPRARWLAEGLGLLCYRAEYRRPGGVEWERAMRRRMARCWRPIFWGFIPMAMPGARIMRPSLPGAPAWPNTG